MKLLKNLSYSDNSGPSEAIVSVYEVHTIVLGSGAAGLNAVVQLNRLGVDDVLMITQGLYRSTSYNTGSDKQTYYKLSLCDEPDSPQAMAHSYFDGGSMHGDLAMAEAAGSVQGFMNLVNLGVPFPKDRFGRFIGYKTDHDPARRATSVGPYTSKMMCQVLMSHILKNNLCTIADGMKVVQLLTCPVGSSSGLSSDSSVSGQETRIVGVVAFDDHSRLAIYLCENLIFAVGGPGDLYQSSVYPVEQTSSIGLALKIGAKAEGLPESQFGLASVKPRWNVSGSYMQVIPRFISAPVDYIPGNVCTDESVEQEFLCQYYPSTEEGRKKMFTDIFLKGYQWPFDSRKVPDGSSMIDLYVYRETVERGRSVWLDFRRNPDGFNLGSLDDEPRQYLEKSGAVGSTPLERLGALNPSAVQLYLDFHVDLAETPLQIALCAQHNNGGLAVNTWWESVNIKHLFPVGEVAGTHGAARPGGSALNAGQVGSLRAAEYIAARYSQAVPDAGQKQPDDFYTSVAEYWLRRKSAMMVSPLSCDSERAELTARMTSAGGAIRREADLEAAVEQARRQCNRIEEHGIRPATDESESFWSALQTEALAFTHWFYLSVLLESVRTGVGSRGSSLILSEKQSEVPLEISPAKQSEPVLPGLGYKVPEDAAYRTQVFGSRLKADGTIVSCWQPRRPLPTDETWFETDWEAFRKGEIYD